MIRKKEFKHPLLIVILVIVIIITILILLNKPEQYPSEPGHFLLKQGYTLNDYFKPYQVSAIILFLRQIYESEAVDKDLKDIFSISTRQGKKTDARFLEDMLKRGDLEIIKNAAEIIIKDYEETISRMDSEQERKSFRSEIYNRIKGYLVEYNKERLRLSHQ